MATALIAATASTIDTNRGPKSGPKLDRSNTVDGSLSEAPSDKPSIGAASSPGGSALQWCCQVPR